MSMTWRSYLPVCSTTNAVRRSSEGSTEKDDFFVHKRGDTARNGLSVAHDEGRGGEQPSAV